jgi:hypothetical protein
MRAAARRLLLVAVSGVVGLGVLGAATSAARTICVRELVGHSGCLDLHRAVAVAHSGDTLKLAQGSYTGGIKIDKSIKLVGVGPLETEISGGGPVVTIGSYLGTKPPKVTIENLEISDGRTEGNGVEAFGGGVYIPPAKSYKPGAKVLLRKVNIGDNVAAPTRTRGPAPAQRKEWPRCPGGPCRFAIALGGGIDNWGRLTVVDSEIGGNLAAGAASDADGGAIASSIGSLTLEGDQILQNRAVAKQPWSRFAEGGGVFVDSGTLRVVDTEILQNGANLESMNANSAGLHVGDGVPTTIVDSDFLQNTVHAADLAAAPSGFDSAMLMGDGPLKMRRVGFEQNDAYTKAGISGEGGSGSVLEVDGGGTITGINVEQNVSRAFTAGGDAEVGGAVAILNFNEDARPTTIKNATITENEATARTDAGAAKVFGAGILNDSLLTLENAKVAENDARAYAAHGFARGGGIWNGSEVSGQPVRLTVKGSRILDNLVAGRPGTTVAGGGIFSSSPLSLATTTFLGNHPEDCSGTGCP